MLLFVDMLRPNRFSLYNDALNDNLLDVFIRDLGGTVYKNCFSPAPDTPRSMASCYTGLYPYQNGCTSRVKWPSKFLNPDLNTVFDNFADNQHKITCFSNPNERTAGLFPKKIDDYAEHNEDFDLKGYLDNVELESDHLVFISIPDYHWALEDWRYTTKGEERAISETTLSLETIFDSLNKDDFDHVFIFSDHGFKFLAERRNESKYEFINRDRTNIFLLHRAKGQNNISYNEKLTSIQDVKATVDSLFDRDSLYSLFSENEREYLVIEDHFSTMAPTVNQNIDMWGIVKKNELYVRTLDSAVTLNWDNTIVSKDIRKDLDKILVDNSQFGKYIDEYEKVFAYKRLMLQQSSHMNGRSRLNVRKNFFVVLYYLFLDLFKKF